MTKRVSRFLPFLLIVLIAVSAFSGCAAKDQPVKDRYEFTFKAEDVGKSVGEALSATGDITLDDSGMVTAVKGRTADWNAGKSYWAFYVGSEYAAKGVNDTIIEKDVVYAFVYTKG